MALHVNPLLESGLKKPTLLTFPLICSQGRGGDKQKFECARCDREGMVKTKGIKRRFEVTLEVPGGNAEKVCIVCTSILS
ncbi:hypothetical protein D3C86_1850970 [compost metagenome]